MLGGRRGSQRAAGGRKDGGGGGVGVVLGLLQNIKNQQIQYRADLRLVFLVAFFFHRTTKGRKKKITFFLFESSHLTFGCIVEVILGFSSYFCILADEQFQPVLPRFGCNCSRAIFWLGK